MQGTSNSTITLLGRDGTELAMTTVIDHQFTEGIVSDEDCIFRARTGYGDRGTVRHTSSQIEVTTV